MYEMKYNYIVFENENFAQSPNGFLVLRNVNIDADSSWYSYGELKQKLEIYAIQCSFFHTRTLNLENTGVVTIFGNKEMLTP